MNAELLTKSFAFFCEKLRNRLIPILDEGLVESRPTAVKLVHLSVYDLLHDVRRLPGRDLAPVNIAFPIHQRRRHGIAIHADRICRCDLQRDVADELFEFFADSRSPAFSAPTSTRTPTFPPVCMYAATNPFSFTSIRSWRRMRCFPHLLHCSHTIRFQIDFRMVRDLTGDLVAECAEGVVLRHEIRLAIDLYEHADLGAGQNGLRDDALPSPPGPLFFAALAAPFLRRISTAASKSPFDSESAFLHSINPAFVFSRRVFTSWASIVALMGKIQVRIWVAPANGDAGGRVSRKAGRALPDLGKKRSASRI